MFRYPGSKKKLKKPILNILDKEISQETERYIEPFFGSGAIGLSILSKHHDFVFNDIDIHLIAFWKSVEFYPEKLKNLIKSYFPSVESFYSFKKTLSQTETTGLEYGFMKMVLHQISYSGLGMKAGGPIGGKKQKSEYSVGCRWNSKLLCKRVDEIHNKIYKSKIDKKKSIFTCSQYQDIIRKSKKNDIIYLDPPYYEIGDNLYQFSFTEEDHVKLNKAILKTKAKWILSYNDHESVIDLYSQNSYVNRINMTCTINGVNKKQELIITNFPIEKELLIS
ncbi:MAG TPA: DNA adenine methylase [Candidatus Paceibacterota bacterium]|nr:DNA adenine methylase [Candidatus Paceibacterota bacterium]